MTFSKSDSDSAEKCALSLKEGRIVIIPTDTVYGFSGIVDVNGNRNFETDCEIRRIKGRSETKPLIQLIARPEDIYLYTDDKVNEKLLSYWPGPLTIIVNIKKNSPLNRECDTVAFRCPGDEWLRKVISLCNAPLYSTSVNRSGCPVLQTESEIQDEFEKDVAVFVKDGDKMNALPSTIVKLESDGSFKVLREGALKVQ